MFPEWGLNVLLQGGAASVHDGGRDMEAKGVSEKE
jgi:hypothetical protein